MALSRQDAWSQDDDIMLAEIVLRHVREGSTQLAAFQEAGEKLSRTAAACGFRWNACIRKKYEGAIELAKKHKNRSSQGESKDEVSSIQLKDELPQESVQAEFVGREEEDSSETNHMAERMQDTVAFLKQVSQYLDENRNKEANELKAKKEQLQLEKNKLQNELEQVKRDFRRLREDYKALLEVMEKARALSEGALPYLKEDSHMEESG